MAEYSNKCEKEIKQTFKGSTEFGAMEKSQIDLQTALKAIISEI